MIRTIRTGNKLKVEYEGLTTELVSDFSAILKGLLADEDMKILIIPEIRKIISEDKENIEKQLDELIKKKGDK